MGDFFGENLRERKQNRLYRELKLPKGLDFASNDYLGLSRHPLIRAKMASALKEGLPLSARASRLLGGHHRLHKKTEESLSRWLARDGVLSFVSGFQANIGLVPALAKNRVIFSDQLNHASLIDACRLSDSPRRIFRHNNLNHLEDLLRKDSRQEKLIITESLFSMQGDFAPLKDLSQLARQHQALLLVDEAHSTGLFGPRLNGRAGALRKKQHIVTVHTAGKAFGSSGAFVASSLLIKDYLINNCRSFIYSTAPSPLLMVQWQACLQVLEKEGQARALALRKKSVQIRRALSLPVTESPIVFLPVNGAGEALRASRQLAQRGFFIPAVRFPAVPRDRQGLRLALHYDHSQQQLDRLIAVLQKIL